MNTEFKNLLNNIYVITLKNYPARTLHILEQSVKNDLKPEMIYGYHVNEKNKTDYPHSSKYKRIAAYGCTLSHKKALIHIKNKKSKYALILEDDCKFSEDFIQELETLFNEVIAKDIKFDILFLYGRSNKVSAWGKFHENSKLLAIPNKRRNLVTHAYIVNEESIIKILKSDMGIEKGIPIDKFYARFDRLCSSKKLAIQERRKIRSVIGNNKNRRKNKFG